MARFLRQKLHPNRFAGGFEYAQGAGFDRMRHEGVSRSSGWAALNSLAEKTTSQRAN